MADTGSGRLWRTQVRIDRRGDQTDTRVTPSGLTVIWLINMFAITRRAVRVLRDVPGLGRLAAGDEAGTAASR